MRTKKITQITNLKQGYARGFTISPDGQWIVYKRGQIAEGDDENSLFELTDLSSIDLWKIKKDGSGEPLLVKNGTSPSWSR